MSRSAGYRIFQSIFYAGYFKHGDQLYLGKHPAMVTLSEYEEAKRRVGEQAGKAHIQKHTFAYAGLMRCGKCGLGITAERQAGRHGRGGWVYYHCANKSLLCTKKSVREDVLERQIDACLAQITITEEFRRIVTQLLERWIKGEFDGIKAQYSQQTKSLGDDEKMLNELVEMRLRGLIDDALFSSKRKQLEQEVSGLRVGLGRTQERLDRVRATVNAALDFRQQARAQFLAGDRAKRREIARALGVRYVVTEGQVFIEMNPLLAYQQESVAQEASAQEDLIQDMPKEKPTEAGCSGQIASSRTEALTGWQNDLERRQTAKFEPLQIGSGKTKKTRSNERVFHGWDGGTEYEQKPNMNEKLQEEWSRADVSRLHTLFAAVCEGTLSFMLPACLRQHSRQTR